MTAWKKPFFFGFRKLAPVLMGLGVQRLPGVKRLGYAVYHRLRPQEPALADVGGVQLYVDPRCEALGARFLCGCGPDEFERELVYQRLRPGMIAVDMGANVGLYTVPIALRVGPTGKVYAFEPDPHNYEILCRNIKLNGLDNVVAYPYAITDVNGTLSFYLNPANHGDHSLSAGERTGGSIRVEARRLDDVLSDVADQIDFVKMDIQGAEAGALRGMSGILEASRDLSMILEFWPEGIRQMGGDPAEVFQILQGAGYRVRNVLEKDRVLKDTAWPGVSHELASSDHTNLYCDRPVVEAGVRLAGTALMAIEFIDGQEDSQVAKEDVWRT